MNKIITNKQGSILALAPLLDAAGNALVLQPKGSKGDEREITAETAEDEIVARVEKAGWVRLRPVSSAPAPEAAPPPPPPAVEEPPPPPAVEEPPPPPPAVEEPPPAVVDEPPPPSPVDEPPAAPDATAVMPAPDVAALAEQTKPGEPPAKVKRDRK